METLAPSDLILPMINSFLPTGRRLWTSVAGAMVLTAVTVDQAHACWSHCMHHYGGVTQLSPGCSANSSVASRPKPGTDPSTLPATTRYTTSTSSGRENITAVAREDQGRPVVVRGDKATAGFSAKRLDELVG